MVAGDPEQVQDLLAAEVSRRFHAPPSAPADLIIAGNHPWPGDPMQSFKVLLQHRAACRSGGVLVGLFWTDPDGDRLARFRSPPCGGSQRRVPSGVGRSDGSCRPPSESSRPQALQRRSCFGGHASWSSTVLSLSMRHRFASDSGLA